MNGIVATLRRIDDAAEYLLFDVALSPGRRGRTLAAVAVAFCALWIATSDHTCRSSCGEYIRLGDHAMYDERDLGAARTFYRKASRADRDSVLPLLKIGHTYRSQQKWDKALGFYRRALDRKKDVLTLFYMGEIHNHMDLPHVALGYLDQALEKNPRFAAAHVGKGWAYDRMKEYGKAMTEYGIALRHDPELPAAYFYRGITRINLKDYDGGQRDFEQVIRLEPEETSAYYNIACAYSLRKDAPNALLWLRKALGHGFREFKHMEKDSDLDFIRDRADYKALVRRYK